MHLPHWHIQARPKRTGSNPKRQLQLRHPFCSARSLQRQPCQLADHLQRPLEAQRGHLDRLPSGPILGPRHQRSDRSRRHPKWRFDQRYRHQHRQSCPPLRSALKFPRLHQRRLRIGHPLLVPLRHPPCSWWLPAQER